MGQPCLQAQRWPREVIGWNYGLVHLGFVGLHIGIGPPSEGSIGTASAEHAPTTPTININTLIAYFIRSCFSSSGPLGAGTVTNGF
jgi:hypothetical protein